MPRMTAVLNSELNDDITAMADEANCSRATILRCALALRIIAHRAKQAGKHIGLVDDPVKLDTIIVGIP